MSIVDFKNKSDVNIVINMIMDKTKDDDSHTQRTPFALCEEIVGKLNDNNVDLTKKVLVVSTLEFVYTIAMQLGDIKNAGNLYFTTPNETKAKLASRWIPKENIFICKGVLDNEGLRNMKFDVVVGNPPYQEKDNKNTKNIWPKFLINGFKVCQDGGFVSFITPRTWTTNALYEQIFLKYSPVFINIDECAKHFPTVGSTFSYYIIQNCPQHQSPVHTVSNNGSIILPQMPRTGLGTTNTDALSIIHKLTTNTQKFKMITSSGYNTMKFSKDDSTVSWQETKEHKHKILHKNLKKDGPVYFYSSLLDNNIHNVPRVVINIWVANYKDMTTETELLTCEQFRHFPVNSVSESETLRSVLLSKLYTFLAHTLVSGGSFTNKSMDKFPKVDLSRSWTDQELYTHFNLTQEEIQLIEDTIK